MKPVSFAVLLALAAGAFGSARAAQCTFTNPKGMPFERAALSPQQQADAASAIAQLSTPVVTSEQSQRIVQGSVVLELEESGLWQMRLAGNSGEEGVIARTDTYGTKRSRLSPQVAGTFLAAVKAGLKRSLDERLETKVKVQGSCWR